MKAEHHHERCCPLWATSPACAAHPANSQVKAKGARKINYGEFLVAVESIAAKKVGGRLGWRALDRCWLRRVRGVSQPSLRQTPAPPPSPPPACPSPLAASAPHPPLPRPTQKMSHDQVKDIIAGASAKTTGTVADAVKFHDDKSLYTGVYAAGGPTNVDKNKVGASGISACTRTHSHTYTHSFARVRQPIFPNVDHQPAHASPRSLAPCSKACPRTWTVARQMCAESRRPELHHHHDFGGWGGMT